MNEQLLDEIRHYWNSHIHDLEVATEPVGSAGFFRELDEYRFDKLRYLPKLVDFGGYGGKKLLEVGCGAGIDLVRFARGGAKVTGVDLAETSIELAQKNFSSSQLTGELLVMNGENLQLPDNSFDVVYAHGVLQYTADAQAMVAELHRVVRPGGQVIMMVYNRISWLNALSQITKIDLEHEDAPVLRKYSIGEFQQLLHPFRHATIVPERFPVPTRLHGGLKGFLYNKLFVAGFNMLPQSMVRPLGWHLMAFAEK